MKLVCAFLLLGFACYQAALVEKEYDVNIQLRYVEDDIERAPRVRRQAGYLRNLFKNRNKNTFGESSNTEESVVPSEESSVPSEESSVPSEKSSVPSEKSSVPSEEIEEVKLVSGKGASMIEVSIELGNGKKMSMKAYKRKKLQIKTPTYQLLNGELVEDITDTSDMEATLFTGDGNGTDITMLMCCDSVDCKPMGSIYGDTAIYTLEPAEAEPFKAKGKDLSKKGPTKLEDVRTLGIGSDGTPLNIPVSLRKKRDLLLSPAMKDSIRARRRRQTSSNNVVEIAFIVDYSEYLYWLQRSSSDAASAKVAIQMYLVLLTNMMDLRFQDLGVTFMISQIIFSTTPSSSPWIEDNLSGDVVNADKALDDVTKWAYPLRGSFLPHDHIMIISKRNLGTIVNGVLSAETIGVAWTGGMCNTAYSISMIEDPGLGLIDFAAAHEIGHSMNSNHDTTSGCSDDDYYIMGSRGGGPQEGLSSLNKSGNPFLFSSCATNSINNFIAGLGSGSCLLQDNYDTVQFDQFKSFFAPGVFLPVDTQCELNYGNGSRRCYALDPTICSDGAWCWNPLDPNYCYSLYVREGTLCADGQRCHMGTCQDSSIVVPTCPPSAYTIDGQKATGDAGIIIDSGNNVAGVGVTVGPSAGTSYATYQNFITQTVNSAEVIC